MYIKSMVNEFIERYEPDTKSELKLDDLDPDTKLAEFAEIENSNYVSHVEIDVEKMSACVVFNCSELEDYFYRKQKFERREKEMNNEVFGRRIAI